MKKLFMTFIAASLALAACTGDDEDYDGAGASRQITFARPVMYGVTRAAGEINGVYPTTEKFCVSGVKYPATGYTGWASATQVFDNQCEEFAYSAQVIGKGWISAKPYFFEEDKKYAFGAYSPSSIKTTNTIATSGPSSAQTVTYDATGLHVTNYFAGDMGSQTDLMYAQRKYDITSAYNNSHGGSTEGTDGNTNATYDGVNLVFRHALASVHFKTCVDPDYVTFKQNAGYGTAEGEFSIISVKINKVAGSGTFNEGITSEGGASKTTYVATPKWTDNTTYTTSYTFMESVLPGGNAAGMAVPMPAAAGTKVSDRAADITTLTYDTDKKGLSGLLVPQTINKDAEIAVTWKQTYRDDVTGLPATKTLSKTLTLKDITAEWKPGYRYIYTIVFSANSIYFAPEVTEWTEEVY